jgi:hypothetical protein
MGDLASPGASVPRDFKLDLRTGELVFERGDLVFVSGADAIAQSAHIRLRFLRGEWFLDETAGADWRAVLGRKYNPDRARGIARKALLETPGVAAVTRLDLDFDPASRVLSILWSVTTDYGQLDGTTTLPNK